MSIKKCLPDDKHFNISFVQTIEKYPCLYDNTLKSYSNRSEQDKAWNQVAELYFSTAPKCKKKWKILRGSLTRYMKPHTGDGAKSKQRYYLWDAMQFVLPFTRSRSQSGNLPIESYEHEMIGTVQCCIDDDENDSKATDLEGHLPNHTDTDIFSSTPSHRTSRLSTEEKVQSKSSVNVLEHVDDNNHLSERKAQQPENPDLDFFKSILPDVGALTASDKRRFKVIVLQTLDDMLQKKNTIPAGASMSTNE